LRRENATSISNNVTPLYVKIFISPDRCWAEQDNSLLKAPVRERLVTPHGVTVLIRACFLDRLPGPIDDWRIVASSTSI
jgi:hypothetical protein